MQLFHVIMQSYHVIMLGYIIRSILYGNYNVSPDAPKSYQMLLT
jgi:hypothetical protein